MGAIVDAISEAFRDFVTDGVPASGANKPSKSEIRSVGTVIESAVANAGIAGLADAAFDTLATANASLAYDAGSYALIYADPTDANNDLAIKVGASGAGSWTPLTVLHSIMESLGQPYVDAATTQAERAEAAAQDADTKALQYLNEAGFNPQSGYEADLTGIVAAAVALDRGAIDYIDEAGVRHLATPAEFHGALTADQGVTVNGVTEIVLAGYEADLLGESLFFVDEDKQELAVGGESDSSGGSEPATSPFSGMAWASFGDSITGQGTWQAQLTDALDLGTFTNCGVGGSRVAKPDAATDNPSMCDDARINAIPASAQLITFMGLTNDFGQSYPLGAITKLGTAVDAMDNTTVYGALEQVALKLLARFSTGQMIVWMTPILGNWYSRTASGAWTSAYYNPLGLGIEDYGTAMRLVAEKYGFPVIELRRRLGWSPSNMAQFYTDDGNMIHPNATLGGPRLAAIIADELQRLASTAEIILA